MERVVRSFHPDAHLPESDEEMAGLYRSVLHGKRVLLLMDSARNREQVEPLIPPSGSLLLITSRFQFTLPGLVARDLDELLPKEACELLLRIAPRIHSSVEEISNLCGRLPLALRLAGSVLAERPELSPCDLVQRLEEGKELGPVAANLKLSYELFSDYQRRLWRLLAVFPGTFDAPAAGAIWDLGAAPTLDSLSSLARSSLVELDDKDRRFRLHDLARSLADSLLERNEKEAARRRHSEHYLSVLREADNLSEKGESLLQGLSIFDSEWGNIQTGQAWVARHFSEDVGIARICSDYPNAGTVLLELRLHPQERIRWRTYALAAARQVKDRRMVGSHLGNLGLAHKDLGQSQEAVKFFREWVDTARRAGDRQDQGQALGFLAAAFIELGDPRRAVEFLQQRLALAREIGDRSGEAAALGGLGAAYRNLGEPRQALIFHQQDLAIAREVSDRRGEGGALNNMGLAYEELGDARRAVEHYEKALSIARETGDRRGEGNALGNLGLAYEGLAKPHRAIELYEQQLAIAREIGDRRAEGSALGKLGFAYAVQDSQRAIESFTQQLTIAQAIGDRRGEGEALGNLGVVYRSLGDLEQAIEYYKQRLAIAREIGDRRSEATASWNLGLAYRGFEKGSASENLRRAADLMQARVDYEQEIGHSADDLAADVADTRALVAAEDP